MIKQQWVSIKASNMTFSMKIKEITRNKEAFSCKCKNGWVWL